MSDAVNVIWKMGDGEMPDKAKYVVDAARSELLLKTLQLPDEIVNMVKYNAEKNAQPVYGYISNIIVERLRTA